MSTSSGPAYVNDRVGDVRPSQLLYTFGIGSIVDLQRMSVMVLGLDDWDEAQTEPISEPRLLQAVQDVYPEALELRTPPRPTPAQDQRVQETIGVPVAPFPRWLRCSRCQIIAPIVSEQFDINVNRYKPEEAEYRHTTCQRVQGKEQKPRAFPVRFLVACENGHLDDFPWDNYVHRGEACLQGGSTLRLTESGTAGEAADVFVKCNACGKSRPMTTAFGESRGELGLMACTGRSPHLREYDTEPCGMPMKAILLGASHLWFPLTYSALHIPRITDEIDLLIDRYKDALAIVSSLEGLRYFLMYRGRAFPELLDHPEEEVWAAIERQREVHAPDDESGLDLPHQPVSAWLSIPANPLLLMGSFPVRHPRLLAINLTPKSSHDCPIRAYYVQATQTALLLFTSSKRRATVSTSDRGRWLYPKRRTSSLPI